MINPSEIVAIPATVNRGLSSAKKSTMLAALGRPRARVDRKCRSVTNEPLRSLIVTRNVGPFRVSGLRPAVQSLSRIFDKVRRQYPEVYEKLGTAGMTCVRHIAGTKSLSNHSWGTAIDLSIAGRLDGLGSGRRDGKTLAGLAAIAPFFEAEGWYWGVGFRSFEDGMHFEVADETIRKWKQAGLLGTAARKRRLPTQNLSFGDRGSDVRSFQEALNKKGYDLEADGIFGPVTHAAVIDYQAESRLKPDGIVGPKTQAMLLS